MKAKRSRSFTILTALLIFTILLSTPISAISVISSESRKIDKIVSDVMSSSSNFNFDDISYVLDHDVNAGEQILQHLSEVAIPAEVPEDASISSPNEDVFHYSVEYNQETGKETIVYENELYLEPVVTQTEYVGEGNNLPPLIRPLTRSYADWTEQNPQNYSNTKSIFKLFIQTQDGSSMYHGSAFKISGNYLGTAGHCLYSSDMGGWAGSILCVPAYRTSSPQYPLGSAHAVSSNMAVGGDWRDSQLVDDDWGIIQLDSVVNTGYMGKRCVGDTTNIDGKTVRIAGYPAGNNIPMTLSWGYVTDTGRRQVKTDYTSTGGQSGSPITDSEDYVIGIHRGSSGSSKVFIKFDNWLFNKMTSYN